MVLVQDVLRQLFTPVDRTLKSWEKSSGMKAKIGKIFRMGNTGPGVFETLAKFMNNYYMWLFFLLQRPWGPLYKRIFEFDMHPTKLTFPFLTHGWILAGWFGTNFVEDEFNPSMIVNNPDYVGYYATRYKRVLPRNILNWRTSAHYIEINRIYSVEMSKKLSILGRQAYEDHERRKTLALTS